MARYLARSCPRCNDYLGIVMRKPARNSPLQAINGRCLACGYRLAWLVVRGRKGISRKSLSYGKENSRSDALRSATRHPDGTEGLRLEERPPTRWRDCR